MIFWLIESTIFVFGLAIGSFLNAAIYRLETEHSVWHGRSFCPDCKHILGASELIPLVSFLWQRGRCHYCHRPISAQYPLVEIATGIVFCLLAYWFWPALYLDQFVFNYATILNLLYLGFISCLFIIIFVYDFKYLLIPDSIVFLGIGGSLLAILVKWFLSGCFFALSCDFFSTILATLVGGGFFLILVTISREKWMGWGDVKLGFLLGLFLGWPNILVAMFLAFLLGSIIGVLLIVSGSKKLKSQVPFGPFLVVGAFVALLWGQALINWYWQFLFL